MIPSPHLNVEVSTNQRKALNPTVRDIQIGAVIAQIFGDKAKTKIAKHCIDFKKRQQLRADFEWTGTVGQHFNVQQSCCLIKQLS